MTQGVEFALGAMVCFGMGDLVYKRAAVAGVPAHQLLMVQTWFFTPLAILYGVLSGTLIFERSALWGLLAGVFLFSGFYNFARSLKHGSISINAPIFRLSFTVTAALAILLLGESVTLWKLAGMTVAMFSTWLLLGGSSSGGVRHAVGLSIVRVLVATILVGIGNLIYKIGLQAGATPATLLTAQTGAALPLATLTARLIDGRIRPPTAAWRIASTAALFIVLASLLLIESLARGEASVLVPIAQMGFVVTAGFGFLFLGEPITRRKLLGLVCAFAALACLARG